MPPVAPPNLERVTRRGVTAAVVAGVGVCTAVAFLEGPWDVLLFTGAMLLFMGLTGWYAVLWHRSRGYVMQHRYLLCRRCGYPLDGLGTAGRCPECGTAWDRAVVRSYWLQRLHPRDPLRIPAPESSS